MRTLALLVKWLTDGMSREIEEVLHLNRREPDRLPWGHTLTLTVGPTALLHEFRCYEPESAPCREGREESDGCLYIESMNESEKPWYSRTVDGWDEEFPPMQVSFIDAGGGDFHWFNPAVGS